MPIILQSQDPDLAVVVNGSIYQLQQKPHLSNLYLERQLEQQWQPMDDLPYGSQDTQKLSIGKWNYFRSRDTLPSGASLKRGS